MLGKNSADNILKYFFLFLENRIWHFMQIVSLGDSLHKYQILFSTKNKKNINSLSPAESAHSLVSVSQCPNNKVIIKR